MKNNEKRKSRFLIIILVLVLGITGCNIKQKNKKTVPEEETKKEHVSKAKPMKPQINILNYQWLSYRMNFSVLDYASKKETINLSAFFVNRKDSIIYMTVGKLGYEGMRVVITPDTVKYVNHLNQTYYCGDYSFISKLLGFKANFYLLQAIFTGEDIPGLEPNMFLTKTQDTNIYRSPLRRNKEMELAVLQELKTDINHKVIENNLTELQTGTFVSAQYGNFMLVDDIQLFFQQATMVIPSEKIQLDCKLKSIKLNVAVPTSLKIPEKYKTITTK
ncbi:MAG: DUF4292 domain-containing protein [Bacteroidales bacterium]|jgi:hypothetical protein|nr:DUF4292 domain-containing protein [Bacteroidales bacterium]